jgi:hypothetical protein
MEWTDEKILGLIKLYEVNPCLFDVSSKDYHNRNVKRNAMERIAKELSTSG